MADKFVTFFHRRLPVIGDAPIVHFEEADYKFWEVRAANGKTVQICREMVGSVSLQERIDYLVWHEAHSAFGMIFADHIVPAAQETIDLWKQTHHKQMRTLRG